MAINYKYIKKSSNTQTNLKAITEYGKENWLYVNELDGILIFSKKEVAKKNSQAKNIELTEDFLKFIEYYRKNITNNGSYADTLSGKYEKALKEISHKDMMKKLEEYKLFLEVNKTRPPVQAPVFLNQRRYMETYNIIKDKSRAFINQIFKELELTAYEIENVKTEIQAYEAKHNKEVSDYNVRSLVHYVRTGEPL